MSKLLIVKTSSLGDVIHALPVLTDLARARPDLEVGWLVEEAFACLPALHPHCGPVIPVALRRWRRSWRQAATRREWRAMRAALAGFNADLVLDLQGLVKSAVLTVAGPGQRLGYDWRSAREPLASLFYHRRLAVARDQHAVPRNRALAAAALGYSLTTGCDYGLRVAPDPDGAAAFGPASAAAAAALARAEPSALLLHATSRDDKLWPVAHWMRLGCALAAHGVRSLLPAGSPAELARARQIAESVPRALVLPPGRLADLVPVFAAARLAVGVDTGLTHLATAFAMPVVALYTATDPAATGVYGSARAVNLGGVGQCPTVEAVLVALAGLHALPGGSAGAAGLALAPDGAVLS